MAITNVNHKIEIPGNQGTIAQGKPLRAAHKITPVGNATQTFKRPSDNLSTSVSFSVLRSFKILVLITPPITGERRRFYVKRQVIAPFLPDTQFGLSSGRMPA